ncbi:response regulator, partial [Lactobacillus sp. XV13L]|nr:response regulator [Lactobacillus sp. XV13L]
MKILIVDDEQLARAELSYLIKKSPCLQNMEIKLFQSEDVKTGLGILIKEQIDIIFLDISLNGDNGFSLAQQLHQLPYAPLIIFATAYDEFAVKAFSVDALDYILKPFEPERINQALTKAIRALGNRHDSQKESLENLLTVELNDRNIV